MRWFQATALMAVLGVSLLVAIGAGPSDRGTLVDPTRTTGNQGVDWRLQRGVQPNQLQRTVTTDALPRFALRFDDGRAAQYEWIRRAVLKYGLPVGLSLNITTTLTSTTGNFMTPAQIEKLLALRGPNGAKVTLLQHWNDNGTNVKNWPYGTPNSDVTEDYLRDTVFDTTPFVTNFGVRPKVMVIPGDDNGSRHDFYLRYWPFITRILNENGIEYVQTGSRGGAEGDPAPPRAVASNGTTVPVDGNPNANNRLVDEWYRPGMNPSPWWLATQTVDLGNNVVERPKASQWQTAISSGHIKDMREAPLPLGNSPSDGWTYEGNGLDHTNDAVWTRTFRADLYRALAGNYGFIVVLHEEDGTWKAGADDADIFGGLSEAEEIGSMHFDTIFWLLARLQLAGHLKVVTNEEWGQWATSDWAPGTDLIGNPQCLIPQVDIGDTIGAINEYFFPRGVSYYEAQRSSPTAAYAFLTTNFTEPANGVGAWEWPAPVASRNGLVHRFPAHGKTSPSPNAPSGGFWLHDRTDGSSEQYHFSYGTLPPGKYQFSYLLDMAETGLAYKTVNVAWGMLNYIDLTDYYSNTDSLVIAVEDTAMVVYNLNNGIGGPAGDLINPGVPIEAYPTAIVDRFYLPDQIPGTESLVMDAPRAWIFEPRYVYLSNIVQLDTADEDSMLISSPQLLYMGK